MKLEKEVECVAPLKKQLDTYRKKAADAEVNLEVVTGDFEQLKKLSAAVQRQNNELSVSSNLQLREAQELQKLLVDSYTNDDGSGSGGMVGAGISELNPAISEELTRLRGDNDSLRRQVRR